MKRKITVFVTAVLLIIGMSASSSCGFIVWNGSGDSDTTPADTAETTAPDTTLADTAETTAPEIETEQADPIADAQARLTDLPERSFSDSTIMIATTESRTVAPTVDGEETMKETLSARAIVAHAVAEKYRTRIISVARTPEALLNEASEAHAAGMYFADLLCVSNTSIGALYSAGLLANMNSLPFTDYTRDYYYGSLCEQSRLGNELRAVVGAASLNPEYLPAVYFNRTLAAELGVDLYKLVDEGKWTLDKQNELIVAANALEGMNGFSSGFDRDELLDAFIGAGNLDFVKNYKNELPSITYMDSDVTAERASALVDKLYNLLYPGKGEFSASDELFASGKQLFYLDELSALPKLTDASVRWGLLPLPKYDESDIGYLSPMSENAPIFTAIASTPDYERPGIILEALNAASHEYLLDTYIDETIGYHLRDEGSIGTLELIIEGAACDFARMFASGFANLDGATYGALRTAVTTSRTVENAYNSFGYAARKELEKSTVLR